MSVPKSVHKISKGNVEYISSCDFAAYSIRELTRAALRDVGKFVCQNFRKSYYSVFRRRKGKVGRYIQYWVRSREMDLQVGIKPNAFYGGFQEFGSSHTPKQGLLRSTVEGNISKIVEIESHYLSALNGDSPEGQVGNEGDMEGGAE